MVGRTAVAIVVTTLLGLGGCGGGGGGGSSTRTPVTVTSVTPANGSVGNPAGSPISATFSAPLDCNSVDSTRVHLMEGATDVPVTMTCSADTVTLQPVAGTPTATSLTVAIDTGVTDASGHPLSAPYSWSFDTAPWTHLLGNLTIDAAHAVATDAAGNVYVAGETQWVLEGQTSAGAMDAFVAKYDKNGVRQWLHQFGSKGDDHAYALTLDSSGNVYVAGATDGDLGGTSAGGSDLFVAKYDTDGTQQWTQQLGSAAQDFAYAVTADPAGNVYAAGITTGALDGQTAVGSFDAVVVKFDASGNKQWTRQFGATFDDYVSGLAADAAGNIYVAGTSSGSIDMQPWSGGGDAFLAKYDGSGNRLWTRQFGSSAGDGVTSVAVGPLGEIYIAGFACAPLPGQTASGDQDGFIARYDASGNQQWLHQFGSALADGLQRIATDASGNVYAAGGTYGLVDGTASAGGTDVAVFKYDADGNAVWTRQFGTAGDDWANGVAVDPFGNVYTAGTVAGTLDNQPFGGNVDAFIAKMSADGRRR